jgi:crotonobetainyl-CoA:carnitine CoA-transferase CaiB-like acyl-CoA transferase
VTTTGPGDAPDETDPPGALGHLRVLDFTALVQGPLATQILGDLGAEVIKFERADGEWSRHWGIGNGRTHGELDSFLAFNRNKRSVAVDLKDPDTRRRILELARTADVVVENFRPGVMDRLGLGFRDFAAVNEAIVYASSSGWGQSGPYAARPGQDMLAQAASGIHFFQGTRDLPPTPIGIGVADLFTGLHLAVAILAAISHRQATGVGQRVEVDLFSCVTALQQQELTYFLSHGSIPERPTRNLGAVFVTAPFGTYATSDGHLVIAMTPCPILADAIALPEIARFDTNDLMLEHREEIYDLVAARLATDTTAHWIDVLLAHDVWSAPVQGYEQLVRDPQLAHNGLLWEVPIGDGRPSAVAPATFRTVGSPITLSRTPARVRRGVPRVGEHTAEIMGRASAPDVAPAVVVERPT